MKFLISSTCIFLLLFSACQSPEETHSSAEESFCIPEDLKPLVKTTTLEKQQVNDYINLTGEISYNENDVVAISSMLAGSVTQVHVDLGDYVRQGQLLATVKSSDIHVLQQEKAQTQNQIKLQNQRIQRMQSMLQDGLISAGELEEAKTELSNLQATSNQVQQNINFYHAQPTSGLFEVRAPKAGYIVEKSISIGKNIDALQDQLFAISNLKEIWVMVNIYATNMQFVQKGSSVEVYTLAYPNEKFIGRIDQISNVFDAEERVLKAKIVLQNPELKLKPGMSADIQIAKSSSQTEMIAVPNSAIIFSNNQQYVLVYHDDCHIEIRQVIPDAHNAIYSYFNSSFKEGEKIISQNELLIFEALNN